MVAKKENAEEINPKDIKNRSKQNKLFISNIEINH